MGIMSDFRIFEQLVDYARKKLKTDSDDYAREWQQESDFLDDGNKSTDAGKSLLEIIYASQRP